MAINDQIIKGKNSLKIPLLNGKKTFRFNQKMIPNNTMNNGLKVWANSKERTVLSLRIRINQNPRSISRK